jgi:hypothetical protein
VKDAILITAYCPDSKREKILRDLVVSLERFSDKFDVILISHTVIPEDISRSTYISIYDSKNEILKDWDLLNQPWFSPEGNGTIYSSFLTRKNTLLAVWRMMIIGFSLANNLGYKKLHHVEYDCRIENIEEFLENSRLLDDYDSVLYMDRKENVSEILFGSFQSYFLPTLNSFLLKLDEEGVKNLIRSSPSKSPEPLLYKLLTEGKKYFAKDRSQLEKSGNKFGIFDGQIEKKSIPWAVPYFDPTDNLVKFLIWNTIDKEISYKLVLNDDRLENIGNISPGRWAIFNLCPINELRNLLVIEDDLIRDKFDMGEIGIEIFKKMSYRSN